MYKEREKEERKEEKREGGRGGDGRKEGEIERRDSKYFSKNKKTVYN